MGILARFLVYFGGAFLGVGVIILSFLRRRMINHSRRVKKQRKMEKLFGSSKNSNSAWKK
jgi:hypothetical protein